MANTVTVQILANVQDMTRGVNEATRKLSGLQSSVGKVTGMVKGLAAGFVGFAAVDFLKGTINAASDLQQSIGGVESIFGKYADTVVASSKKAAQAYGLSANEYNTSASLIGATLGGQGVATDQLAGRVDALVARASDLSATFGGPTSSAVEALGAAFRGEFDSLDKYGISLKASDISAELAARGQDKLKGEALKTATAIATQDLIMKQSAKSAGQFSSESGSLAGSQQILKAKFENVKATVGTALLPALASLTTWVSDKLLPALKDMGTWISENIVPALKDFGKWVQDNSTWLGAIASAIGAVVASLLIYQAYVKTVSALTKAWGAIQAAFNIIMALNPFVAILLGIIALVAALIYAWKHSETFRNIVIGVWNAVKNAVMGVLNWFTGTLWPGIKNVLQWIGDKVTQLKNWFVERFQAIVSFVQSVPGRIQGFFSGIANFFNNIWNNVKNGAVNIWNNVLSFIRGLPGKIIGVFASAGSWLFNIGKNILEGLWNGIKSMGGWIANKVGSLVKSIIPGPIRKVLGIASPSKLMAEYGRYVQQGLIVGMENNSGIRAIKSASANLANTVSGGFNPSLSMAGSSTRAGFAGQGGIPQIIINAGLGTDPSELERAVVGAIKGYSNQNGSGWMNRL